MTGMNKMQHLNYCRQIEKLAVRCYDADHSGQSEDALRALGIINMIRASQKFLLPFDGRLLGDEELRALDDSEPLRLPHQQIALEFRCTIGDVESKRVVFCLERPNHILVIPFASWPGQDWSLRSPIHLPKTGYIDRSIPGETGFYAYFQGDGDGKESAVDARTMLGLCNALACCNVRSERSGSKPNAKKVKSSLPFDDYHILVLENRGRGESAGSPFEGRSPREHLRRGHIRRLADGRRIWVNAHVVAAGRGAGIITKDYALKIAT